MTDAKIIRAFPVPPARVLSRQQRRAIELLADGFHVLRVSEAIGIGCLEIRGWYDNKLFLEELEKRIERRRLEARHMIEARAIDAVETLGDLLEHENPDIKIRAAEQIIKHTEGLTPASRVEVNETRRLELTEAQLVVLERIASGGSSAKAAIPADTGDIADADFTEAGADDPADPGDAGHDRGGDDGAGA